MLKPTLTYQKIETLIAIRIGLIKTPEEMTQLSGELRDLCEEITFSPDIRVIYYYRCGRKLFFYRARHVSVGFRKKRRPGA